MYIDTHSHIYDAAFDTDRELVFQRALEVGVDMILLPNTDETTIKPMMDFYENHLDNCKVMMGLHPEGVKEDYKRHLSVIEKEMERNCWVGVGEIGLDLYWDKTYEKQQVEVLKEQLRWAKQLHLPVALHTREAFDLMFNKEMGIPNHFTCFLRNLYLSQEATVRSGDGTMDWFQIGKRVHQGCILSSVYLTSLQSTSCKMPGWVNHKL